VNAAAVMEVIASDVGRMVIANPRQVRLVAHAKIKTDTIDAAVRAKLYASNFLREVWVPDAKNPGATAAGHARQPDRPPARAFEDDHAIWPKNSPLPCACTGVARKPGPSVTAPLHSSRWHHRLASCPAGLGFQLAIMISLTRAAMASIGNGLVITSIPGSI
jgi:hypothetical protein